MNLATFVGYSNSYFYRNWAYCDDDMDCLFGFYIDSKKGHLEGPFISSNLFNGQHYVAKHIQASQVSPDMDEIDPFDINVTVAYNDFLNIQEDYFLFGRQSFCSSFVVFANVFSALNSYFLPVSPTGVEDRFAFLCNAWLCSDNTDCGPFPESVQISDVCENVNAIGEFSPAQFEEFFWDGDASNTDLETLDIYDTTSPPIAYRPCNPEFEPIDDCIFSFVVPTRISCDVDSDDIQGCNSTGTFEIFSPELPLYFPFGEEVNANDFRNSDLVPHRLFNSTAGFLEIPDDGICPAYIVWWSLSFDPFYIDCDLAPNPQILLPIVDAPNPPDPSPTPVPFFSPSPITFSVKASDKIVEEEVAIVDDVSLGDDSVASEEEFQEEIDLLRNTQDCSEGVCGSERSATILCVESVSSLTCENYFETSAWTDKFPDCVCVSGCYSTSTCGKFTEGMVASTVIMTSVQATDFEATKLAKSVRNDAYEGSFDTAGIVHVVSADVDDVSSAPFLAPALPVVLLAALYLA